MYKIKQLYQIVYVSGIALCDLMGFVSVILKFFVCFKQKLKTFGQLTSIDHF